MKAAGSRLLSLLKGESGQTLPLMMLASGLFIAMGGITIDVGRAFIVKRDLQGATDAAALAGAYSMSLPTATSSSVKTLVSSYGSTSTGQNINPMLQSVTVSTTLSCLTTVANWGVYCSASTTGDNALQVVQTGTIKTLFI
jgi:Flp pilus assembly protein TadG